MQNASRPRACALVLGCFVAACGGMSDADRDQTLTSAGSETEPAIQLGQSTTIARFSIGGFTVAFEAAGDGPDAMVLLAVGGSGPNPVSQLHQQYGMLTSLELFLAFAPDTEPPPVLVATHPEEAQALGRPDDRVIRVEPLEGVIVEG